jgi:hypothetical protein
MRNLWQCKLSDNISELNNSSISGQSPETILIIQSDASGNGMNPMALEYKENTMIKAEWMDELFQSVVVGV